MRTEPDAEFEAVFPGLSAPIYFSENPRGGFIESKLHALYQTASYADGSLAVPWGTKETVDVPVYRLSLKQGKILRELWSRYAVRKPQKSMTWDQYMIHSTAALNDLPRELFDPLQSIASESRDEYSERLSFLEEMVSTLAPAIKAITKKGKP